MSRRRVVVTGLGIVSPVGVGVADAWANILAARSGVARITRFDASAFTSQIAAEVKNFDVSRWLSAKEARRYDTFIHYGLVATMEAVRDAGLDDRFTEFGDNNIGHDRIQNSKFKMQTRTRASASVCILHFESCITGSFHLDSTIDRSLVVTPRSNACSISTL